MKKLLTLLLAFSLLFGVTACGSSEIDPQKMVDRWDRFVEMLGKTQITPDAKLIGERTPGEDTYVGTYYAHCNHASGRDVVFGGGSIQERTVQLQGHVDTENGAVQIRVRLGDEVSYVTPNAAGDFAAGFSLKGGGNYLMLDYEDFSGTITLTAFYPEPAVTT